jgi:predicted phage terminase large subunit-like protein
MDESPQISDIDFATIYEQLVKAAKVSFVSFLYLLWPQQPGQTYLIGSLHDHLAHIVDGVVKGTRKPNQSVSVPPQHGKSRLLSVRAVAWLIGAKPGIRIALCGVYEDLMTGFFREAKEIMAEPGYRRIFGLISPVEGVNRQNNTLFGNGSEVQCRSIGSKLVGRGVDWLIVDDPHAGRAEAESPAERKRVHQWFFSDCITRLSPDAKVFLISTRWHPEDLHAKVTDDETVRIFKEQGFDEATFEVTNIPAVCDDPATDPLGREEGEACFPEYRTLGFLNLQRTRFMAAGEMYEWWSQYQGQPKPRGGNLADVTKIIRLPKDEVPTDIEWVRGIDPACAESTKSDRTAGALCAARFDSSGICTEFYLVHMFAKRGPYATRKQEIENQLDYDNLHHGVNRAGVEGVGGFEAIMQETKSRFLGRISVEKKNFRGGRGGNAKALRAQPWFNLIEAGRFYMVEGDWNEDFIQELEYFPSGKHDDQIDAVSIAREVLAHRIQLLIA